MPTQLTIDGREVDYADVASTRHGRGFAFTAAQREILRLLRLRGIVTSTEAGLVMHAHRGSCGFGARGHGPRGNQCCPYCATDGLSAMRRLMQRGLVKRLPWLRAWGLV